MRATTRAIRHLTPFACALALAALLPAAARAQAAAPHAPHAAHAAAQGIKDVALTAEQRQQYVGAYLISIPGSERTGMSFRVFEEAGLLYGQPDGAQPTRMLYQGNDTFLPQADPESVVTFTLEKGRATGFSATSPGGPVRGTRVAPEGR